MIFTWAVAADCLSFSAFESSTYRLSHIYWHGKMPTAYCWRGWEAGYKTIYASQVILKIKGEKWTRMSQHGARMQEALKESQSWLFLIQRHSVALPAQLSNFITWVLGKQGNVRDCASTVSQRGRPVWSLLMHCRGYCGQGWTWTWDTLVSCESWYFLLWSWSKRNAKPCPLELRLQAWIEYSSQ